jgi:formamidopyrimidine-DNA glycosylase
LPELPEVESVRRALDPWMTGAAIDRVEVRRPDLRRPFPKRFESRLTGQTVLTLSRRAKYLLATVSSGDTLLVHLGMSGWLHVDQPGDRSTPRAADAWGRLAAHDHVVFHMSSGVTIAYNDPRRFGVMELLAPGALATHAVLSKLGPEPLAEDFDDAALARACRGKKASLKAALLDQRVVAGLGNIYACEALHRARLFPQRRASTIATPAGRPRESAHRLADAITQVLREAIARRDTPAAYRTSRFRVYDREGERCPRRSCDGIITRRTLLGRSTFYCPVCQR